MSNGFGYEKKKIELGEERIERKNKYEVAHTATAVARDSF